MFLKNGRIFDTLCGLERKRQKTELLIFLEKQREFYDVIPTSLDFKVLTYLYL